MPGPHIALPGADHEIGQFCLPRAVCAAAALPKPLRTTLPAVPAAIPVNPRTIASKPKPMPWRGVLPGNPPACSRRLLLPVRRRSAHRRRRQSFIPHWHHPGRPIEPETRASLERPLGCDLAAVRPYGSTRRTIEPRSTRSIAVGQDVFFDAGRFRSSTPKGRWLLATRSPTRCGGSHHQRWRKVQRQPNDLGSYPEAERRSIVQSNIPTPMIDAERLMDHFGTEEGATTTINFDGTTVFGTGIDPAMKHGLTNTGAYLATETNVLPLGSTVTLHLDLTPFHRAER